MRRINIWPVVVAVLCLPVTGISAEEKDEALDCPWEAPTDALGKGTMKITSDAAPNCDLVIDQLYMNLVLTNEASISTITRDQTIQEQCVANVLFADGPKSGVVRGCLDTDLADGIQPGSRTRVQRRGLWLAPLGGLGALAAGDDDGGGPTETVGSPGL